MAASFNSIVKKEITSFSRNNYLYFAPKTKQLLLIMQLFLLTLK